MASPVRLNRLFQRDGRCLILSFDHGFFAEPSWLEGLRDLPGIIRAHAAEEPDGMTLPTGGARLLQAIPDRRKPALLLRADTTNAYLAAREGTLYDLPVVDAVRRAVALDAVCVVSSLLTFPGQPGLTRDCCANLDALRAQCDRSGMPLMIEILAMTDNAGVPLVDSRVESIAPLVRLAVELGADVVKADPTDPVTDFRGIVGVAAGVPVLASGGLRAPDREILQRTAALIAAGAQGIAYGRNVMWAERPTAMTRALGRIVHGAPPFDWDAIY